MVTSVFADDLMKYISYIELIVGMGLALGPAIGSIVYPHLGYAGTMYFFGALNFLAMCTVFWCIPDELDGTVSDKEVAKIEAEMEDLFEIDDEEDDDKIKPSKESKLSWKKFLSNKSVAFALTTCFFGTFNLVFFYGYIATELADLGLPESDVGYVMALQNVTYLPMCLILPRFCESAFPKKLQFVIAMLGYGLTCFLLGPSNILGIPYNKDGGSLYLVISAFPLMGIFQYFIFIPVIPEMLERLQGDLEIVEGEDEEMDNAINDKVNDAYGFIYAFSSFASPLIGSAFYSSFGAPKSCDIWAFMNFGLAGIFFIFNCGIFVFSEHREFSQKLEKLKEQAVQDGEDQKADGAQSDY